MGFWEKNHKRVKNYILFSVFIENILFLSCVCGGRGCVYVIADYKENINIATWKTFQGKTKKKTFPEEFMFQENLHLLLQRNKGSVNSDFRNMQDSSFSSKENGRRVNFKHPPAPKSYKRGKENH